nr:unnamed protein product [Digitaria exilis]
MGQEDLPKFTVIIAQKNHHTKLFQADAPDNVPPVAPICYAHLAAAQMGQFMKFEDFTDTSSGSGANSSSSAAIPELPRLHADVCSSMFFC